MRSSLFLLFYGRPVFHACFFLLAHRSQGAEDQVAGEEHEQPEEQAACPGHLACPDQHTGGQTGLPEVAQEAEQRYSCQQEQGEPVVDAAPETPDEQISQTTSDKERCCIKR